MSRETVELVRNGIEAYTRGDLAAALTIAHPDIVWKPVEEAPSHGRDAVRSYLERWEEMWDELETRAEELIDAGDRVVVTLYFRGRGKGSGMEVEQRSYQVHTVEDGQTVRMEEFLERAEALEAAGLGEPTHT